MNHTRIDRELWRVLATALFLCLSWTSLHAQSIQAIAGTLDVTATGAGFSRGITTGQILIPFVDSNGDSSATPIWFSPGDGSGGYVHCAVPSSFCSPADIASFSDILTYQGSGGDSPQGTFWDRSLIVSCMQGGGTVTKKTLQHTLNKTTGILTLRGTATVSGSIMDYSYDVFGLCDDTNLIASYMITGTANYTAQFILDTQSGRGDYIFQWMHISFTQ